MGIRARGVGIVLRGLSLLLPSGGARALRPVTLGVALAASAVVVFAGAEAEGKTAYDSPYGYDRTWNAALRLVRVDLGMKVVEKDDANGYLLFEYRPTEGSAKTTNASIELIRGAKGDDVVKVVAQIAQMPKSHEDVLLEHLSRKMRTEYGEPPTPRAPAPAPAPDAGPDNNNTDENR